MEITISNADAEKRILELMNVIKGDTMLPVIIGYKINSNICALEKVLEPFNRTRDKIINDISGGKPCINANDNPKQFEQASQKINEIASETVRVEIKTITLNEISSLSLPINILSALYFMIKEEEN
jgi:hypothetical protein